MQCRYIHYIINDMCILQLTASYTHIFICLALNVKMVCEKRKSKKFQVSI